MNRFRFLLAACVPILLWTSVASGQVKPLSGARLSNSTTDPNCGDSHGGMVDCEQHSASFDSPQNADGTGHRSLIFHDLKTSGPSVNFGNYGGWTVTHVVDAPDIVFGTSGIDQYEGANIVKNGVGDLAGLYFYVYGGGRAAASDEGVTGITVESGEINGYFHGTVHSGGAPGSTALTLVPNKAQKNWRATCVGCMLLDISKGSIGGMLNGPTRHFGSTYLFELPTTGVVDRVGRTGLPLTHAWCTTVTSLPFSATAGVGSRHTIDCVLGRIGNSTPAFTAGGVVTVAGPEYPEQAAILATEQPSAGHQTLTLSVRNPHEPGSILFQGGIAGQSLSFDENLAATGFRTSYYVFGSVDGVNLIYGSQIAGSLVAHGLPRLRQEAEQLNSGFHLYPSAEIVANTTTPSAPQLEPNSVDWEMGDTVENPRFQSFGGFGVRDSCQAYTPTDQDLSSGCMLIEVGGPGVSGTYHPFRMMNYNSLKLYRGGGGVVDPVPAISLEGIYSESIQIDHGPLPSTWGRNAIIDVVHTATGDQSPFNLFSLPGSQPGQTNVTYDPATLLIGFPEGIVTRSLGTTSNCANNHNPANCGSSASGSIAIPAGSNSVTVVTGAVTANSQILITPDATLDSRLGVTCNKDPAMAFAPMGIVKRTPGGGFVLGTSITISGGSNCYSFAVMN